MRTSTRDGKAFHGLVNVLRSWIADRLFQFSEADKHSKKCEKRLFRPKEHKKIWANLHKIHQSVEILASLLLQKRTQNIFLLGNLDSVFYRTTHINVLFLSERKSKRKEEICKFFRTHKHEKEKCLMVKFVSVGS